MKIRIKKIRKKDRLWYASYTIFMVFFILSTSFYYKYFIDIDFKIILTFCMVMLITREILYEKYSPMLFAILILCMGLIILVMRNSSGAGSNSVACIIFFSCCARNISFEKIASFTVILCGFLLIFIVSSSFIGIIQDYIHIASDGRVRHYLGFRYALYPSAILFNLTALFVYYKKEQIKFIQLLVIGLINYIFYRLTGSRLSFYTVVMLIMAAIILKNYLFFFHKRKIICTLMTYIFPISFIVSLWVTARYSPSVQWMFNLNKILDRRISLGQSSLIKNGISLFGENLSWVGNGLNAYGEKSNESYSWVDSMYIQLLQHYGIFFCIVILALLVIAMRKCYHNKDYWMLAILSIYAIHGLIDDLIIYAHYNTFWIAIGVIIMKEFSDIKHKMAKKDFVSST